MNSTFCCLVACMLIILNISPQRDEDEDDDEGMQGIFDQLRRQGAQQGTFDDLPDNRPSAFTGTGRTLQGGQTQGQQQNQGVVITFYR